MITLPLAPSDADILVAVDAWVHSLTQANYPASLALITALPHWTADLLERVMTNYGDPTLPPRRTSRSQPSHRDWRPNSRVDRFANGTIEACCDLPLDGEWSDLTANLAVRQRATDSILELQDIHIM